VALKVDRIITSEGVIDTLPACTSLSRASTFNPTCLAAS